MPRSRQSPGELLRRFILENGLKPADAARLLKVSPVSIHYWMSGQRPNTSQRLRIARWTGGRVPFEAWLTARDLAAIESVQPYLPETGKVA